MCGIKVLQAILSMKINSLSNQGELINVVSEASSDFVGLVWSGLGWVGLDWSWLGWVGLGWSGLGWVGLSFAWVFSSSFGAFSTITRTHLDISLESSLHQRLVPSVHKLHFPKNQTGQSWTPKFHILQMPEPFKTEFFCRSEMLELSIKISFLLIT